MWTGRMAEQEPCEFADSAARPPAPPPSIFDHLYDSSRGCSHAAQ